MPSTVIEVNQTQAAFCSDFCYTTICSETLNAALQPYVGMAKIGTTAFSILHRDYQQSIFEILRGGGNPRT